MRDLIAEAISAGGYDLTYMLRQIEMLWLEGSVDSTERDELKDMARSHAVPEDSYAPDSQRILSLESALRDLEARVSALEASDPAANDGSDEPSDGPALPPEYTRPTGAHDAYMTGDTVTYAGKVWECLIDGCVWSPGDYPAAWREVGR